MDEGKMAVCIVWDGVSSLLLLGEFCLFLKSSLMLVVCSLCGVVFLDELLLNLGIAEVCNDYGAVSGDWDKVSVVRDEEAIDLLAEVAI